MVLLIRGCKTASFLPHIGRDFSECLYVQGAGGISSCTVRLLSCSRLSQLICGDSPEFPLLNRVAKAPYSRNVTSVLILRNGTEALTGAGALIRITTVVV